MAADEPARHNAANRTRARGTLMFRRSPPTRIDRISRPLWGAMVLAALGPACGCGRSVEPSSSVGAREASSPVVASHDGSAPSTVDVPPAPSGVRVKEWDLGPLRIDKIYRSMDGPYERATIDPTGVDWVTGYTTAVVDAGTGELMGDEFFCHSQVQLLNATRLLVTATGIAEVRFPEGFAMPLSRILAGMPEQWRGVTVLGMVLNNHEPNMNRTANVRARIEYLTDQEARSRGLKKLYKVELPMTVIPKTDEEAEDASGEHCVVVGGLKSHWMVPPGEQTTRKRFTGLFPVDSRVHYAAVHLHNYGVSMRLRDVTEDKVLWKTEVVYEPDRVQIAKIPFYSSTEGFPVYTDHEYEIEALYDNKLSEPTDAMAVMYLFYSPNINVDITYPDPPPES